MNTAVIVAEQEQRALSNNLQPLSTEIVVDMFASSQDIKPSSRSLYKRTLKQYFSWVESKGYNLNQMSIKELIEYKEELLAKGMSTLTISSYITSLRKFYEWAEANKFSPNIAAALHSPKRRQQFRKQPLKPEQATRLLTYSREERAGEQAEAALKRAEQRQELSEEKIATIKKHFETTSLRDYAIVNLLLRTGLRCIEVVRADLGDITFKGGQRVLLVQGKGRDDKDSFVILTEKAWQPMADYIKSSRMGAGEKEPLFASESNNNKGGRLTTRAISFLVKESLKSIGLDDKAYTAHSLRHTAAVNILRATNWNIEIAQRTLRHTNPATTQIYTETAKEEERLSNAGERFLDNLY